MSSFPTFWAGRDNGFMTFTPIAVGTELGKRFFEFEISGTGTGTSGIVEFDTSSNVQAGKGQTWRQSFFLWRTGGDFTAIDIFANRTSERGPSPTHTGGSEAFTVIANPGDLPTFYSHQFVVQDQVTHFLLPRLGIKTLASGDFLLRLRAAEPELRKIDTLTFNDEQIISIRRLPTQFPRFQTVVGYSRNFTVDTGGGVADAAPDAFKAFARQEFRGSDPVTDTDVLLAHPRASDVRIDTALSGKIDADTEAARLNALHKVRRDAFEVVLRTEPFVLDLNTAVVIQSERHGLSQGKRFLNVELDEQTETDSVTLVVWG